MLEQVGSCGHSVRSQLLLGTAALLAAGVVLGSEDLQVFCVPNAAGVVPSNHHGQQQRFGLARRFPAPSSSPVVRRSDEPEPRQPRPAQPGWRSPVAWAVTAVVTALRRVQSHKLRVPAQKAQFPVAEASIVAVLVGAIRAAVQSYRAATASFQLRDDIFQEMAVAQTYRNSIWPWTETLIITVIASTFLVLGIKTFIKSMKEWEQRQELKEMEAMGTEDALFLMSTPVDAVPLDKKKKAMRRRLTPLPTRIMGGLMDALWLFRVGACVGYLLPLLNILDFGEISISLYPHALGVPPSRPIVDFMQTNLGMRYLYNAYLKSGYYFLIVWFLFIQLAVRNKAAPFFVRFHSSQAILISMLLGVPQQVFFAVLNPWESGLVVQKFMYHSMVAIFLFTLCLIIWCCLRALMKQTMSMPLVSEAAVMWAGKE